MDRLKRRIQTTGNASSSPISARTAKATKSKVNAKNNNLSARRVENFLKKSFPAIFPWLVTVVTLVCRTLYVIKPKNWWMIHPDEVFQSVEVAHISLYGYGFRTYEFSPPADVESSLPVTRYREMELNADMYGLRSPLYPYFYTVIGWLVAKVGWHCNPYLLWRVAHVFVSSSLPLVVYRYVCTLYRSVYTGCLAAILVASSGQINTIGTHCLVHSFLCPFTFFSLCLILKVSNYRTAALLSETDTHLSKKIESKAELNGKQSSGRVITLISNNNDIHKNVARKDHFETAIKGNVNKLKPAIESNKHVFSAGLIIGLVCYIRPDVTLVYILHFILYGEFRSILFSAKIKALVAGLVIASLFGTVVDCAFYDDWFITPLNWFFFNVIGNLSTLVFGKTSSSLYWNEILSIHGIGFILAISFLIEIAFSLYVSNVQEPRAKNKRKNPKECQRENQKNLKSKVDCQQEKSKLNDKDYSSTEKLMLSFKPCVLWMVLFLVYLMNGHKELRFIHDTFVFILIYASVAFLKMKALIRNGALRVAALATVLGIFAVNQWIVFPTHNSSRSQWWYQNTENVHDVNACLHFLSSRSDVTGVFSDGHLHMTGGMTLLHQNVPIVSLMTGGYYEFGPGSRVNLTSRAILTGCNISMSEFTRATNYVALTNTMAVVRLILQSTAYNYVIIRRDVQFIPLGFSEVFAAGSRRVLKRKLDALSEETLQGLLHRIPLGQNATILLHEGDVLYNMNQYREAIQRFQHAIHLNASLVEAYLPLENCHYKLGNVAAAQAVRNKCRSLFSTRECSAARKITRP